ncbi:UDP-N-acetylmuramoyl-tripeptide--D-alanyl-D-alanine ligase [Ammonicoccus fulvus]|uniref:UDP-N-acetylmuramoyl-tripeptide--D-alanyl-D-alanine ligase n=1 Tax=Ammonicoccus fulvus TaxID=3138240 RepID=A0ABZ3FUR0_9ACTN
MEKLTLRRLAEVVDGRLHDEAAADRLVGPDVVIDSREATPGTLFVAFAGEQVDGHNYIAKAAELGAVATLCQHVPADLDPEVAAGCVIVADQTTALGKLARHLTEHPGLAVIGITGSQGKTSTKDLVAQVLSGHGETVAPQGSFNNEIGVPLTATRVNDSTRFLVSEMGARGIGHIRYLCSLTPPSIGVVLNVGHAHVGEFGSQGAIAEAKGELVEALPADGWAVLNGTDRRVVAMASRTRARVALFSGGGRPDTAADLIVWADGVTADEVDRHSFTLRVERTGTEPQAADVALRLVGRHHVGNAAAAAAAALCAGMELPEVARALSEATPQSRWRMEVSERTDGVIVVNDAYNANPDSMLAALDTLARITRRRRTRQPGIRSWAILGQMFELGETSLDEHVAIARAVGSLQIDHLIALGEFADDMKTSAWAAGCPAPMTARDAAHAAELATPAPGDVMLVKASRAVGLEKVADALLAVGDDTTGVVQ